MKSIKDREESSRIRGIKWWRKTRSSRGQKKGNGNLWEEREDRTSAGSHFGKPAFNHRGGGEGATGGKKQGKDDGKIKAEEMS